MRRIIPAEKPAVVKEQKRDREPAGRADHPVSLVENKNAAAYSVIMAMSRSICFTEAVSAAAHHRNGQRRRAAPVGCDRQGAARCGEKNLHKCTEPVRIPHLQKDQIPYQRPGDIRRAEKLVFKGIEARPRKTAEGKAADDGRRRHPGQIFPETAGMAAVLGQKNSVIGAVSRPTLCRTICRDISA